MTISSSPTLALGGAASDDLRRRRHVGIFQGALSGLASRFVGILTSFLAVPLTISYLGVERYGVWVTLASLLAWLQLADLGVGNGLTNAIAGALGTDRPDIARTHVSTSFFFLSVVALGAASVTALAWPFLDWAELFGVRGAAARAEIGPAIAVAITISLAQLPFGVVGKVYLANQDGKLANYWAAGGNVASLLSLLAVTHTKGGLVWLVTAVSGTGLLATIASGAWLFLHHTPHLSPHPRGIRMSSAKELGQVGPKFFLIQIMALIVFQTDNLFLAHFLGARSVAPYSVTYKLFGYTSLIQTLAFSHVWAAYADAFARKDFSWIRRTFLQNISLSLTSTIFFAVLLLFLARPCIKIWAGGVAVPPIDLCFWMAAWSVINAFTSPIGCLLAAAARLNAQMMYSAAATLANVGLSIVLIKQWGITGAIAGTVIAYLVFVCGPCSLDAVFLIRRLQREL